MEVLNLGRNKLPAVPERLNAWPMAAGLRCLYLNNNALTSTHALCNLPNLLMADLSSNNISRLEVGPGKRRLASPPIQGGGGWRAQSL